GAGHGEAVERALGHAHFRGKVAIKVRHFLALPQLIANSDLIATVPRRFAESLPSSWDLRIFDPPIALPPYDVKQYWHERYHLDPGNRWLRGVIASLFIDE